jgi:tyrosine-protein phosphatase non-receptor type 4
LFTAELGDFNSVEHTEGYLSELQLLVDQNEETERQVSELHKLHRGQMPGELMGIDGKVLEDS